MAWYRFTQITRGDSYRSWPKVDDAVKDLTGPLYALQHTLSIIKRSGGDDLASDAKRARPGADQWISELESSTAMNSSGFGRMDWMAAYEYTANNILSPYHIWLISLLVWKAVQRPVSNVLPIVSIDTGRNTFETKWKYIIVCMHNRSGKTDFKLFIISSKFVHSFGWHFFCLNLH